MGKWPIYRSIEDSETELIYRLEYPDGEVKAVRTRKDFINLHTPLTQKERGSILNRDFDLRSPQIIAFTVRLPGLGDLIILLELVIAMKALLSKKSRAGFKFLALLDASHRKIFTRFLAQVDVFDKTLEGVAVESLDLQGLAGASGGKKVSVTVLDGNPGFLHPDHLAIGSVWDTFWARWGLPGRFVPGDSSRYVRRLEKVSPAEYRKAAKTLKLPPRNSYVLMVPEAASNGERKKWPVEHWKKLVSDITARDKLNVVINTTTDEFADLASNSRVFFYNYTKDPDSDLLRFTALIESSRAVVSIDTSAAHIAGFLDKKCLVLWGPTTPVEFGHRNNVHLRVSLCPPCRFQQRSQLCHDNVCMRDLSPSEVSEVVKRILGPSRR